MISRSKASAARSLLFMRWEPDFSKGLCECPGPPTTQSRARRQQQRGFTITYDGIIAGEYVAERMVEQALPIELKAVNALNEAHHAQCIDYLKSSGLRLGLLLHFGMQRLEIERIAGNV